ncbi:MAG: hypothetical protein ACRC31_05830, partial [Cetobacterium sp.]
FGHWWEGLGKLSAYSCGGANKVALGDSGFCKNKWERPGKLSSDFDSSTCTGAPSSMSLTTGKLGCGTGLFDKVSLLKLPTKKYRTKISDVWWI